MRDLSGKVCLVTGAASGIGREIALRLAESQARLVLADVNGFGAAATARDAERLGAEAHVIPCDLSDLESVCAVAREALDRWAGVDVLVNNAGVTYHGATHTMPQDEWDRLVAINFDAPVRLTLELLPSMLARPEAHVLNVASMLGLAAMPRVNAYCTTKFAMVGFSDSLRAEYRRSGLGVTTLCPGFVSTNLFGSARPETEGGEPKAPPAWVCHTPEGIARRAVRAIERNQGRVVIDPYFSALRAFKHVAPALWDAVLSLGSGKRIARKQQELQALHPDPEQALRIKLGLDVEVDDASFRRAA